jgi:NAD(P)-dependent dehydrogenase (short-subunit alcohol dehydrogenase family)
MSITASSANQLDNSETPSLVAHDREASTHDNTINSSIPCVDSSRFANKTIAITGAGGSFGREGCIYFCQRGARIAAVDQNAVALAETFQAMQIQLGKDAHFDFKPFVCDVTNVEQVQTTIQSIADQFGRIDLLWNNAGYQGKIQPLLEYDPADFELVMKINVTGTCGTNSDVERKEQGIVFKWS